MFKVFVGFCLAAALFAFRLFRKIQQNENAEQAQDEMIEAYAFATVDTIVKRLDAKENLPFVAISESELPQIVRENLASFGDHLRNHLRRHLGRENNQIVSRRQIAANGELQILIERYVPISYN